MAKCPLSHPSADWGGYFARIKTQCPWSFAAWQKGLIDVVQWEGDVLPLHPFSARVYLVKMSNAELETLAESLDEGKYEWLFSYPGYGEFATSVPVLIQQDRKTLAELRVHFCPTDGCAEDREAPLTPNWRIP